jgi:DNA-binding transcriptional regulator YiaG
LKELLIKSIQLPLKHNKIAFKMPSTTLAVPSSKLRKWDENHHQPGESTKLLSTLGK